MVEHAKLIHYYEWIGCNSMINLVWPYLET